MASTANYHRVSPPMTLTLGWSGRFRTWRPSRITLLLASLLLPLLAMWCLATSVYVLFHDQLIVSLISRQTEIQYGYEDRIALLRTQLDRQTGRALLDRQALDTSIRDLAAKSERLEARSTIIDSLVRGLGAAPTDGGTSRAATATDPEKRADLAIVDPSQRVAASLAKVEARQSDLIARLREPATQAVARLQEALKLTGLSPSFWRGAIGNGVGGPFVPLPDDARSAGFDLNLALLKDVVERRDALAKVVDGLPLKRPLEGHPEVTSPFGARVDPFLGRAAMHTGVDLLGGYGGIVRATAGGIVTVAGGEGGYGNMVEIDHGNGLTTRYAHLSAIDVVPHQKIASGTIVGRVGSTGRATGPHLHYETRVHGEPVDPTRFLDAGSVLYPS